MGKVMEKLLAFRRPVQLDLEQYLEKLKQRRLSPDGREIPSSVPVAPPVGYKKQPSMVEMVREMVRSERLRQEVAAAGAETFEEAEDFDVGDEPDMASTPYENDFDPPLSELLQAGSQELAKKEKAAPPSDGPKGRKATQKPPEAADGGNEGEE